MNYVKIYNSIVEKARTECRTKDKGIYYEAHHILPKCLGGTGKVSQWKYHPNIVLLTAKEHYICHKLLCRIYPGNKELAFALVAMGQANGKRTKHLITARGYEELKQLRSFCQKGKTLSQEAIRKRTETRRANGTYTRSEESIRKMIETRRERGLLKQTPEAIKKRVETRRTKGDGYVMSEEQKRKISQTLKGRKQTKETIEKRTKTKRENKNIQSEKVK